MKRILFAALTALSVVFASVADCLVPMSVISSTQPDDVPESAVTLLKSRLEQIAAKSDIATDMGVSSVALTGKFHTLSLDAVPGAGAKIALHAELVLYMVDNESHTIFSTLSLDLKGVGESAERAYTNALRQVNASNSRILDFVAEGRDKVVAFYDSHLDIMISRANRAASAGNYDEALWLLSRVPECCKDYQRVEALTRTFYTRYAGKSGTKTASVSPKASASPTSTPRPSRRLSPGGQVGVEYGRKQPAPAGSVFDWIK